MRLPLVIVSAAVVLAIGAGAMYVRRPSNPAPAAVRTGPVPAPTAPAAAPSALLPPADVRSAPSRRAAAPTAAAPSVEAAPATGTLHVEADVPGAIVFFDRVSVGTAPMTIPNVAPGQHRLNVSATGYETYGETIAVEPGSRTVTIKFKDVTLDVKIDAVHKHGMGSCKGVLGATVQGLRYEALDIKDGKDSFTVALAELDVFEVDYLAKNLRLRTRQGRTYNFGDPAGNADRLFTFHRDVETARKRLAANK